MRDLHSLIRLGDTGSGSGMTERIAFQQFHAIFGKLQIFRKDNFIVNDFKLAHMGTGGESANDLVKLINTNHFSIQKKSHTSRRGFQHQLDWYYSR